MSLSYDLGEPDRFTAGALGEPGRRVFYFQVFAQGAEVALKCEKQQAQILADHLTKLLADLPHQATPFTDPAEALPPTELEWPVGSISIGVDRDNSRLLVMFEELVAVDPDDESAALVEPAELRVRLTPEQVWAYAAQVDLLVSASRPLCRLCEAPIDPSGHACPRLN